MKCLFFGKFGVLCFFVTPVLRFALLPYYRRTMLAIKIYEFQAGLTPPIMSNLFVTRGNKCNLRNFQALESFHKRTVIFGTETVSYSGRQILRKD